MYKFSVSKTFQWALMLSTLAVISACGQNNKGSKSSSVNSSSSSSQAADPFASRLSARKSAAFVLNIKMDEVQFYIDSQTIPNDIIREVTTFSYDSLNRFTGLETRVFPQSDVSNLPLEGAIALTQKFTFRTDNSWQTNVGTMEIWDNWWDGASGNHVQTTIWTDTNWNGNRLISSNEEVINYDQSQGLDFVRSRSTTASTNTFNNEGYVEAHVKVGGAETQFVRANDGITLSTIQSDSEVIEYFYNAKGGIDYFETTKVTSGERKIRDYEYAKVNDQLAILIEEETYDASNVLIDSRVEVQLYDVAICNKSSLLRNTYLPPHYRECFDLSDWDGV